MTTDLTTEQATAKPTGIRRLRATVTDAGGAAKRRLQRFRGPSETVEAPLTPEGLAAVDDAPVDEAAPAQRPGVGLWRAIMRAKLAVIVILALVQVAVALISWRIKGRAPAVEASPLRTTSSRPWGRRWAASPDRSTPRST